MLTAASGRAPLETVYAVYSYRASNEDEISFGAGDAIYVLAHDEERNDGWWTGRMQSGDVGFFPINFTSRSLLSSPEKKKAAGRTKGGRISLLIKQLESNFTRTSAGASSRTKSLKKIPPSIIVSSGSIRTSGSINSAVSAAGSCRQAKKCTNVDEVGPLLDSAKTVVSEATLFEVDFPAKPMHAISSVVFGSSEGPRLLDRADSAVPLSDSLNTDSGTSMSVSAVEKLGDLQKENAGHLQALQGKPEKYLDLDFDFEDNQNEQELKEGLQPAEHPYQPDAKFKDQPETQFEDLTETKFDDQTDARLENQPVAKFEDQKETVLEDQPDSQGLEQYEKQENQQQEHENECKTSSQLEYGLSLSLPSLSFVNQRSSDIDFEKQRRSRDGSENRELKLLQNIIEWSVEQVATWIKGTQFSEYAEDFQKNEVDGEVLLSMDHATLKELGIATLGRRVKMINQIKLLLPTTKYLPNSYFADGDEGAEREWEQQEASIYPIRQAPILVKNPNSEDGRPLSGLQRKHFLPPAQVAFEGYLKTLVDCSGYATAKSSPRKRRYIVLSATGCLYWLNNPHDHVWYHSLQISSGAFTISQDPEPRIFRHMFTVSRTVLDQSEQERKFYFYASRARESHGWVKALSRAAVLRKEFTLGRRRMDDEVQLGARGSIGSIYHAADGENLIVTALDQVNRTLARSYPLFRDLSKMAEGSAIVDFISAIGRLEIPEFVRLGVKWPGILCAEYSDNWVAALDWCERLRIRYPRLVGLAELSSGLEISIATLVHALVKKFGAEELH